MIHKFFIYKSLIDMYEHKNFFMYVNVDIPIYFHMYTYISTYMLTQKYTEFFNCKSLIIVYT
jgi:hypothetical protein